jgi:thiol-disulfide isomerase/thioredoxin
MIVKIITFFIVFIHSITLVTAGEKTIPFSIKTLNNEIVHIDSLLQKKPVLITFWALWCKPCKEELQGLKRMNNENPFDKVTIVSVNLDTPRSIARVKSYVATHKFPFIFCTDPNQELLRHFNGVGIPFTVFIDKSREIVFKQAGYVSGDEILLKDKLKRYLEDKK